METIETIEKMDKAYEESGELYSEYLMSCEECTLDDDVIELLNDYPVNEGNTELLNKSEKLRETAEKYMNELRLSRALADADIPADTPEHCYSELRKMCQPEIQPDAPVYSSEPLFDATGSIYYPENVPVYPAWYMQMKENQEKERLLNSKKYQSEDLQ